MTSILIHYARVSNAAVARRVALRVIPEIVRRGLMEGGTLEPAGTSRLKFVPETIESVIDALNQSWPADHLPVLGELPLWLNLTETGGQWLLSRGLAWD